MVLLTAGGWPGRSRAQSAPLSVTRELGSEDCPDAGALAARVTALRMGEPLPLSPRYRVRFTRSAQQRSAALIALEANGERVRVLNARGPSCEPLAQAVALTLALLLDEQARAPAQPARGEQRSAPEPARTQLLTPVPERAWSFSLGAGALLGVTRAAAPLLLAELGFAQDRFRVDLGAAGVPVQRVGFAPGSLREWLAAGSLRACYLPYHAPPFSFGSCAGAYLGVLDVRARGYTRNARRKELWTALPLELFFGYTRGPTALQLAAQALIPLRRPDFSIDGLGTAYASWPVSMVALLRIIGIWRDAPSRAQKK